MSLPIAANVSKFEIPATVVTVKSLASLISSVSVPSPPSSVINTEKLPATLTVSLPEPPVTVKVAAGAT